MPKAMLEFQLPEETAEFENAVKGGQAVGDVLEFRGRLRGLAKYGDKKYTAKQEEVLTDIYSMYCEHFADLLED